MRFREYKAGGKIMLDVVAAGQAVSAIAGALGVVDKVYSMFMKFRQTGEIENDGNVSQSQHTELISVDNNGTKLIHSVDGKTVQTVTREELGKKLNKTDLTFIVTYEKKMSSLFEQWVEITKDVSLVDPRTRARHQEQIKAISDDMADCLRQVFGLLSQVGI